MAVTTTSNTVYMTAQDDSDSSGRVIQGFSFSGATAGNVCVVKEGSAGGGEIIFRATVGANGDTVTIGGLQVSVVGFKVTTLTAGDTLTVYVA